MSMQPYIVEYIGGFVRLNISTWRNRFVKNDFVFYKNGRNVDSSSSITCEYINIGNIIRMSSKSSKDASSYTIYTSDDCEYEFISNATYINLLRRQFDSVWTLTT
jgi:hypothetical protein